MGHWRREAPDAAKVRRADKVLLNRGRGSPISPVKFFICICNPAFMDRLLSILFSVVLLTATSPPRTAAGVCDVAGNCSRMPVHLPCRSNEKSNDKQKPACPVPVCCVCGPCCCVCLVPEQPVLHRGAMPEESENLQPGSFLTFHPQPVWLSIWKPPATPSVQVASNDHHSFLQV